MELALVVLMIVTAVTLLVRSSRARAARLERTVEQVQQRLGAHLGRSRFSPRTAFLDHQDMVCGVYFGEGASGDVTGVFFKLAHDEAPQAGSVRVSRRGGPAGLGDYAPRAEAPGTGDAAFDGRFRVVCEDADRGFAFRWMDPEGRRLVAEVARRQGDSREPVAEYLADERLVRVWAEGHLAGELELEPLIELAARLARRITGKPRPEAPAPRATDAIEV